MSDYKVCILAAGVGTRIGDLSKYVNKAILPVNFKGVISYIVEKFPKDVEIVVTVGHLKEKVINYLEAAHPDRKFNFVEVDKFIGPGTGPGYSLLACKDKLQCPFIISAADTIVLESVPQPTYNWFGVAELEVGESTERYCTAKIKNNIIYQLDDKIKTDNKHAFIGLAGIKDFDIFFSALEKNRELIGGELQISNGFNKLIERGLRAELFTWIDTGTTESYRNANKFFSGSKQQFDFSKGEEFIYFVGDRVIKFFADSEMTKKRVERAKTLEGLVPNIIFHKDNFYAYEKIEGDTVYNILSIPLVKSFLCWVKENLWKHRKLSYAEKESFQKACKEFYYDKLMKRLDMFYKKTNTIDSESEINGTIVPPLENLLEKINWDEICNGIPSNIHGDLNFSNVLVTKNNPKRTFILLDWRQDFSGLMEYGDLYYDLAKMYAGLIISWQLIKDNMFSFDGSGSKVYYDFYSKNSIAEAREVFEEFIEQNNFDLKKIKILTALVFLNMSALHNEPFDSMCFYMGKHMLHKFLNED